MGEILHPAEQQLVLRQRFGLHVVARIEVTRDAVVQLQAVNGLILAFGVQRAELRFRRRPVANAERLTRISLGVRASRESDRAVAIFEIFLLVSLEPELVDPAIDGVATVDSEGHNRIIYPVFVPALVQRVYLQP